MRAPPTTSSIPPTAKRTFDVSDFLAAARNGTTLLYCSLDLASLGESAVADVAPLSAFDLRAERPTPTRGVVWLGGGRPVTHAHYDTAHNLFVQILGRKRFHLWPPTNSLPCYPSRHSLHRQSSLANPLATRHLEVILEEGDALYLPPFYTHHVEALTNLSVSVAVWSESDECRRKDALESLPLPWEGDWPAGKIVRAASLFLRGVLTHAYDGDEEAGRRTLRALLESRYEPLRSLPEADREGLLSTEADVAVLRGYCVGLEEDGEALRLHVAANARRVGEAVRAVSSDEGIVRIALGNYLEAVAEFAVAGRRERIYAVLSECVLAT